MWTDELDALPAGKMVTEELYPQLVVGAAVRIVTRGATVYEGLITSIPGIQVRRSNDSIVVCGRRFHLPQHDVYLIDPDRMVEKNPAALVLTEEEIRDCVADLSRAHRPAGSKPTSVSPLDIAQHAIGFDPSVYGYSSSSKESNFTPFIKVGALKKSLSRLVEEGVLRKVVSGGYGHPSVDDRYVFIHGKAGYVTTVDYEESVLLVDGKARIERIAELRKRAEHLVAERYPQEVEAELARLVEKAGL
jgi:hypothetical protein